MPRRRPRLAPPVLAGLLTALLAAGSAARAQEPHVHGQPPAAGMPADTMTMEHEMAAPMAHAMTGPLGISMVREGSGTSWQPDASPMYAIHRTAGPWLLMFHGNAFVQYLSDGSDRGDDQFGSVNWGMAMARRAVGRGELTLRAMLSAEAATVGACGYPDLLATGETCSGGEAIHDRQHPHDLFMELAAAYAHPLGENLAVQLYGGPVGEPALGPVAYPHRLSAMPYPLAPISHHWLDATHISFGVVTAGVYGRRWKLEGSLFNGREPDENRTDLDLDPLDSYAGRLWLLPNDRWALQASVGRLTDAEPATAEGPAASVTRSTFSAMYHRPLGAHSTWASTLAFGANREADGTTGAGLLESTLFLDDRHLLFARAEVNGKTAHDLVLPDAAAANDEETFTLGKAAVGYAYQFRPLAGLRPGIGFTGSLSIVPDALQAVYGRRASPGVGIFLSLRPTRMEMGSSMDDAGMAGMHHAAGGR